jgi:hypothetical protein
MVWGVVLGVVVLSMGAAFFLARWRRGAPLWPDSADLRANPIRGKRAAALVRLFWLAAPLLLILACIAALSGAGRNAGPLWAGFFACLIVQASVAGVFGLQADPASSIALGACVAIELFVILGIGLFVVFDFADYFAVYAVGGILAIVAGIVFAAARSHARSG